MENNSYSILSVDFIESLCRKELGSLKQGRINYRNREIEFYRTDIRSSWKYRILEKKKNTFPFYFWLEDIEEYLELTDETVLKTLSSFQKTLLEVCNKSIYKATETTSLTLLALCEAARANKTNVIAVTASDLAYLWQSNYEKESKSGCS